MFEARSEITRMSSAATDISIRAQEAKTQLDAHVREIIAWHFNPETGCPFWLDFASTLGWDPRREITSFDDLRRCRPFKDDWLRGVRVRPGLPWGLEGKPFFTFKPGG